MWLGSTAQHAVRAVLYITEHGADDPVQVDEIAAALDAPRNYLSKTLHQLVRAGVLCSVRGPNGGFQLVDAPHALSVARIVAPFIPSQQTRCLMGRPDCGGATPCAAHHRWRRVADGIDRFFEQTSAAQLLADDNSPRAVRNTAGKAGSKGTRKTTSKVTSTIHVPSARQDVRGRKAPCHTHRPRHPKFRRLPTPTRRASCMDPTASPEGTAAETIPSGSASSTTCSCYSRSAS